MQDEWSKEGENWTLGSVDASAPSDNGAKLSLPSSRLPSSLGMRALACEYILSAVHTISPILPRARGILFIALC